ncbi:hypothetical protein [Scleromatobacter humisilvae]|uniref:Uncharacterized protein n=1 Tax=Scleromatobacter humisilvae TaxID=2897159 RepID=A0A9X1YIU4_9BURK|nr:hypothetical protein [Scleromatobacter humisilvae]MCK9687294.1 hypothetical protein [Scleromatobacter humisilvae]
MDDFIAAATGRDGGHDTELMAFAARMASIREKREAELEASLAGATRAKDGPAGNVDFVEVVRHPVDGAVKVDVEVVDAAASGAGSPSSPESPSGDSKEDEPVVVERSDYAVKRVEELSEQLAQLSADKDFKPSDEVIREAADAAKINIKAQNDAKKAQEAAAARAVARDEKKKAAAAEKAATVAGSKRAVKQSQ